MYLLFYITLLKKNPAQVGVESFENKTLRTV